MQEIYGNDIHSRVNEGPTVVSIPYAAIKSITAPETSPTRYTFVRADTGKEIATFRPRRVAETLKIELSSGTVMNLDGGKELGCIELHERSPCRVCTRGCIGCCRSRRVHRTFSPLQRVPGSPGEC